MGLGVGLGVGLGAGQRDLATERRSRAEVAAEGSPPPGRAAPSPCIRPTPTLCRLRRSSSAAHPSVTHLVRVRAHLVRVGVRGRGRGRGRSRG